MKDAPIGTLQALDSMGIYDFPSLFWESYWTEGHRWANQYRYDEYWPAAIYPALAQDACDWHASQARCDAQAAAQRIMDAVGLCPICPPVTLDNLEDYDGQIAHMDRVRETFRAAKARKA